MTTAIWKYLSIKKDVDGIVIIDTQRIQILRDTFYEIYGDRDIEDDDLKNEYIKKLIHDLELIDDQISSEYLNICVSESSADFARIEIKDKVKNNNKILQSIPSDDVQPASIIRPEQYQQQSASVIRPEQYQQQSASITPPAQVQEQKISSINKIICIIHQKSTKIEIDTFLRQFLFRQANQKSG
jgi:hypothetical protein